MSPRELAAKARASAQLLDLVLSNSADSIYVVDQDYRFVFLHSPRQLAQSNNNGGKPSYENIMGKSAPCDFCLLSNSVRTQHLPTVAVFDREEKQYQLRISGLMNGDETPLYLHFLRDMTTRARREPTDAESQQLRPQFSQPTSPVLRPLGFKDSLEHQPHASP